MKNKILFSFITSLAFLFISSSDLKAQDDGSAYAEIRANGTKFSLDIYWKYVGSSNDEEGHYWIYIKNVNLNSKNLTLWERCYKYNNNELWLSKVKLNRETREFQLLQLTKYNLDNAKIVSSVDIEFPKWSSFITSLAFLFISSSDLKAQDDGSAYAEIRANGTKYSLDIYWKYVGSSNDEEGHYWIYIKNVNLNSKNLTLWERCYKYNNNELWLSKVKLNRETREFQLLQLTKYNLDNVKIVSSVDIEFPKWSSFGPGTIGDYKFDLLDILEKQQKLNR